MALHLPLGLLGVGVVLEWLSHIWSKGGIRTGGRWMMLMGALLAVPSVTLGLYAYRDVVAPAGSVGLKWRQVVAMSPWSDVQWLYMYRHGVLEAIGPAWPSSPPRLAGGSDDGRRKMSGRAGGVQCGLGFMAVGDVFRRGPSTATALRWPRFNVGEVHPAAPSRRYSPPPAIACHRAAAAGPESAKPIHEHEACVGGPEEGEPAMPPGWKELPRYYCTAAGRATIAFALAGMAFPSAVVAGEGPLPGCGFRGPSHSRRRAVAQEASPTCRASGGAWRRPCLPRPRSCSPVRRPLMVRPGSSHCSRRQGIGVRDWSWKRARAAAAKGTDWRHARLFWHIVFRLSISFAVPDGHHYAGEQRAKFFTDVLLGVSASPCTCGWALILSIRCTARVRLNA